jgi:hypothetical protein
MNKRLFDQACEAQAIAMVEFGYPGITADFVREAHRKWKEREPLTDVVEMFCESAFNEHPMLFGHRKEPAQ